MNSSWPSLRSLSRRSLHPTGPQPALPAWPGFQIREEPKVCTFDLKSDDWTLYSVWSGAINTFLSDLQGLKSPIGKWAFMSDVITFVKSLFCFHFNGLNDPNSLVLIVKGSGYQFGNGTYEVDTSEITFIDAMTEARPAVQLRCGGKLAHILSMSLKPYDILVIPQCGGNTMFRLSGMGNVGIDGVTIGESIETIIPTQYENPWEARYKFEYVLNVPKGSVGIIRHRQASCTPWQRFGNKSYLEKYLFPIVANAYLMDVINLLGYYDASLDPSWPTMYDSGHFWMGPPRVPCYSSSSKFCTRCL